MAASSTPGDGGEVVAWQEPALKGRQYECNFCKEIGFKSEMLIDLDDPAMDWQGHLPVVCYTCWQLQRRTPEYQWKAWKKVVASTWLKRSVSTAEHYEKRARVQGWDGLIAELEERQPGEARKAYRRRLLSRVCTIGTALVAGLQEMTKDQQDRLHTAMEEWQEDCRKKAENDEFVPILSSIHLSDFEAQFLSELVPGLDEYFLCRQRSCLAVTHNNTWIHNSPNGQYLCPSCAQQYRPWKEQPGYCKANKVFIVDLQKRPESRPVAPGAITASSEVAPGGTIFGEGGAEYCAYPTIWADTATSTLVNKFKEVTSDADRRLEAMPPDARLQYVNEFIVHKGSRAFLKKTTLSQTVVAEVNTRNSRMAAGCPTTWKFDHLREGFDSMTLDSSVIDEPLSQTDLILLWGMASWMATQAKMHQK